MLAPIHKKKKQRQYIPFGYKLMLTYMFFIVIPVIAIGYFSNAMYQESIRKHARTNLQGTLLQIRNNIEYKLEDVERVSSIIYDDYSLVLHLRHFENGWDTYDRTVTTLRPKFQNAMQATRLNMSMFIFLQNQNFNESYYGSFEQEDLDMLQGKYNIYHLDRLENQNWYTTHPEEVYGKTMVWKMVLRDEEYGRISLLRRMVDVFPLEVKEVGFMRFSARIQELFEAMDYLKIGEGSVLLLRDEQGQVLYQSGEAPVDEGMEALSERDYLVITETLNDGNWKLHAYVPMTIMERDSARVSMFILGTCVILLIVFSIAGMFISRYFSVRVMKIVSVLNAFREGDLHKRMRYRGKDEFSQIASALNEMGQNIDHLIEQVYLTQIEKKEAELESLQAQINPHFLYNTLSSISRLAKFGKIDKLQKMVLDLAKFYRLSLNEGRTVIPIRHELEQAEAYLNIQRTKYGDKVTISYDLDPEIVRYVTIKLILQPFIENAMEHAWFGDALHIRIEARKAGDSIVFKVIDNGLGMSPVLIRRIFDPVEGQNVGFGIRNVNSRIQLHFGAEYGVTIGSRPGMGTTVQIVIPATPYFPEEVD
ncbi:cache domain-containing sensor histidine kinase [Paenibacillus bouchesdurhonensis]|uniref:cache domain-containing sensor histidine kinase n=1 Tax=Paenibacillus bouchesdurhonensis TaxID=1870990 RepID=UPI000DA63CB0|nr:sensor histidine kinase [Paenibacillus bouchesdurhonensis]